MPNSDNSNQLNMDGTHSSMSSHGTIKLEDLGCYKFIPNIRIQWDWQLYKEVENDNFWLSYQKDFKHSVNASIRTKRDKDNKQQPYQFESENGFKLQVAPDKLNQLNVNFDNISVNIYAPYKTHKIGNKRITSAGSSPDGDLGVYGATDGILEVFDTYDGQVRRKLTGHVGDVDLARFFPSGKVVLSGASDARLKIWDATEGTCAATLIGHSGGITSGDFVDRGRNLVSTSRDGSAKLWDVPTSSIIKQLAQYDRPINSCFVADSLFEYHQQQQGSAKEFGTEGKTVVLGAEEGFFSTHDLRSNELIAKSMLHGHRSAINACTVWRDFIFGGDQDGFIFQYDKRKLDTPMQILQFTNSPIHQLANPVSGSDLDGRKLWCTSGDGNVFLVDFDTARVVKSLSGIDTDVVTSFTLLKNAAFTSSRDSLIRCFKF